MSILIGETSPPVNKRCAVTGKTFGPGQRQKRGFIVQVINEGERKAFFAASRGAAEQIAEQLKKDAT